MKGATINAGDLRDRVVIEYRRLGQNQLGEAEESWKPVAKVWANVEPLSGREYFLAQQVQAETTHSVEMRFRPGLNASEYRLKIGATTLNILSAIDVENLGVKHVLMCKG